jgi:hypothetical protein
MDALNVDLYAFGGDTVIVFSMRVFMLEDVIKKDREIGEKKID